MILHVPYTDVALPLANVTYTLFKSAGANASFPPGSWKGSRDVMGWARYRAALCHDQNIAEITVFRSIDNGVTWNQVATTGALALVAGTAVNIVDLVIEQYQDIWIKLVNSGTNQTVFRVDQCFTDVRDPTV